MNKIILLLLLSIIFVTSKSQCLNYLKVSIGNDGINGIGINNDSTLYVWGNNAYGQLGDSTKTDRFAPKKVNFPGKWIDVCSGYEHSLGITNDGKLWSWGRNEYGELGIPSFGKSMPTRVGTGNNWVSISAGRYTSYGITSDGKLWAWGLNSYGQLGDSTLVDKTAPVQIGTATNWKTVVAGQYHTVAITTDGKLWAWGRNDLGQLGDGSNTDRISPTQIGNSTNWKTVTAGLSHALAITTDGKLWAWGLNSNAQLGVGNHTNSNIPIQVGTSANWQSISGGSNHSLGITTDGKLWGWGRNIFFELGDSTNSERTTPMQIGMGTNWRSVSAGKQSSLGITNSGNLFAWGSNYWGQGGIGTTSPDKLWVPTITSGFTIITAQPVTQSKCAGNGFSFSVTVASADTLKYQWKLNGFDISGATGKTYTKTNSSLIDSGYYTVVVMGRCIAVSDSVKLNVNAIPDTSVTISGKTISSVLTNGATYKWIDCSTNNAVSGATSATFTPTTTGNYKLEITRNGCTAISSCHFISLTGMANKTLKNEINVYPNPVSNNFNINLFENKREVSVEITDINGRVIQSQNYFNVSSMSIRINGENGIYFIKIVTQEGDFFKMKIIKE